MLKSVNAPWSGNYRLKKTLNPTSRPEDIVAKDEPRLRDEYEHLRSYVLSPAKPLSRPLGLDIWCKKGFSSWIDAVCPIGYQEEPARYTPMQSGNLGIVAELPISLTNIILEWSKTNGRINYCQG